MISVVAMVFRHTLEDCTFTFACTFSFHSKVINKNYSRDLILTSLDFNTFFAFIYLHFYFSLFFLK